MEGGMAGKPRQEIEKGEVALPLSVLNQLNDY
jgi:hypothetical protein